MVDVPSDLPPPEAGGSAALLAALVEDLDEGFAELVRTYQRVMYSVAMRVCGIRAESEDLIAEAFLRAYRALGSYDDERIMALRPQPWLLTILLNTWRNAARTAARRPGEVPIDEHAEHPASEPSVEQQVERRETRGEIRALLARLPESQRVAVVLRHVFGLPTAEVAEVLGIPEGTAKAHASRGLRKLRELHADQQAGQTGDPPTEPVVRPVTYLRREFR